MKSRDKVLFICSHTPNANAPEAGHKTAWRNIERLAQHCDVDVLLVTNLSELHCIPSQWPDNVTLLESVAVSKLGKLIAVLTQARNWSPRFAARLTPNAIRAVKRALTDTLYDRIWLEFTECGSFLDLIPLEIPVTISAPDVLIQWALRNRSFYRFLAPWIFDDELAVLTRANLVEAQSPKDAELIRALYSIQHVSVEMPALAPFLRQLRRSASTVVPHSLMFWGAMSRHENSRAVLSFLDRHWPRIVDCYPDAVLYIVGSSPPIELVARASSQIIVTGFVDDPSPYFAQAALGIAPLEEGAGIKVKVLEMLEAGMPVLSTPIGAEGIAKTSLLKILDFSEFSDGVINIFRKYDD
jgi:polysaccharide biosynthesis protein PslH